MQEDGKKFFDVSKPHPHPTSKPVIVGHHPMMPDPMLREGTHEAHAAAGLAVEDSVPDEKPHPHTPNLGDNSASYEDSPAWNPSPKTTDGELSDSKTTGSSLFGHSTSLPDSEHQDDLASKSKKESNSDDNSGAELHVPAGRTAYHHQPRIWAWVVIALIILAGIYAAVDAKTDVLPFHIFSHTQSNADASSNSPNSSNSQPVSVNQSSLPTGFTKYQPTGTPVVFAYPTDWGAPTTTTDPGFSQRGGDKKSDGTYAYLVHFATNKDIEIAMTSSKYLPSARTPLYYDYLQWCVGTNDSKFYKMLLHFSTSAGVDSPTTVTCDQGPLTDATKINDAVIAQLKTKDAQGNVLGDIYTANLSGGGSLAVLRVKDTKMTNGDNIKKLINTIAGASASSQ